MARHHLRSVLLIILLLGVALLFILLPRALHLWKPQTEQSGTLPPGSGFPVTVRDTCERDILVKQRPVRIVSLAPVATEILFAIGAGDRIIAVTQFCDYPPEAKPLPKIGGYLDPNVEKVSALTPDLIVGARGNSRDVLDRLYALGLPIVVIDPTQLDEIPQAARLIGRVTGNVEAAEELAHKFTARKDAVVARLAPIPPAERPRVLFLFSLEDQGGVFTAGPGSHVDELVTVSGGQNIAAASGKAWPQLSMETVAAADPQVILVMQQQMNVQGAKGGLTHETALARLRKKTNWRGLSAVKTGNVFVLDDDLTTIPGPRLIEGVELVASVLHPAMFAAKEAQ